MGLRQNRFVCVAIAFCLFQLKTEAQVNPKEKMAEALSIIQEHYVDSLSDNVLVDAAIAGMMMKLDPHSSYFTREEAVEMKGAMDGSFVGIGIQYTVRGDSVFVLQVIADGPADKGGILAGDRILGIDSVSVTGKQFGNYDVMKLIRGGKGTPISLQIVRKGAKQMLNKTLIRDDIPDNSVKAAYMLDDQIGYIGLRIFNKTTRKEVDAALDTLIKQGMKSLVLDLQGNGGGLVDEALGLANEFLPKGRMVFYKMEQDKGKDYFYTAGSGRFLDGKLVVLIDESTASASELLSGALQDWDRAVVVGRRSFGKGLMQLPYTLFDRSVIKLTGARYYTPTGRSVQKPYVGSRYQEDVYERFVNGELTDASKIHFPDSLKFQTLLHKRTVYGGGGIMPDRFVPIDSLEVSDWLMGISGAGIINRVAFDFIDRNRMQLQKRYPTFDLFDQTFQLPDELPEMVVAEAASQGLHLKEADMKPMLCLLSAEIKAQLAGQLFENNCFYIELINRNKLSLREALGVLKNPAEYNTLLHIKE